ncbi:MAG: hypothetical protein ABI995_02485, partial [Acidobacteriota bacterium]
MIRIFSVSVPVSVVLLVISETLLLFGCHYLAFYRALDETNDPWFYFVYENGWIQVAFEVFVIQIGLYLMDQYEAVVLRSKAMLIQQLCLILGGAFLLQALIGYSKWTLLQLPQWSMVYGSLLVLLVISAWRAAFFAVARKTRGTKLLFLGCSPSMKDIALHLSEYRELGLVLVGSVGIDEGPAETKLLGDIEGLDGILTVHRPVRLVVSQVAQISLAHMQKLLDLRLRGIDIQDAATLYEDVFGRVLLQELRPAQLIFP